MKNLNNSKKSHQIWTTSLLLSLLFFSFITQAQQFLTDYGTPQNEWGYSGLALENTSNTDQFVVVGKMENAIAGSIANDDIYFSRLDINGNILPSTKLIGTTSWEKGNFIEKVFNPLTDIHTGYVVTGSTHNGNPNERDLLITLTDLTGNVICSRAFGDPNDDEIGFSVIQDEDGNFVATGYKINNTTGLESVYTVKMDFNCGLIWTNSYESPARVHAYSICTADNITDSAGNLYTQVYALTGKIDQDIFIILLDKNGLVINEYRYDFNLGTNNQEIGYCIQQDFDGGFVVTGETVPFGTTIPTGTKKIFVHKTDMLLNYMWLHEYDMPSSEVEYGKYIHLVYADPSQSTPNGYILTGRANRNLVEFPDNSTGDAFLLRLDMTGIPVWSNSYKDDIYKASHGNRVDVGYLMQSPSFFVSGHSFREDNTGSIPQFDYDILAFSTDMNGSLAATSNSCYTQIPTTITPMQGPNIAMNSNVVGSNLSFDPNIDDIPFQEAQLFCEDCINTSFTDLGTYNATCDEMIDSTNPIFSGLSPNCSSCTWVYQATNLPVVFPIDVSTYPSNSSFVITCIDLTNCCETILKIETGCCDDACPTNWLGVNYIDPCCVELDLEVADNCHTFKKIITEIITPDVNYSSINLGAPYTSSWMGSSIDPQTIAFTPITPTTGSFPNLVELCIENIGGIMPQQIDVHYVVCASTGLDSIACTESIYLQCPTITPTPCLDIKSDTVYCNAVGDYFLDFCVTNNGPATCMMTDLNLWVTAPMTISPSAFTGLIIAPGECFCGTLAIGSTAIGGAMSGDPLEIFFSSNCCPNDVATLNTVLPDCGCVNMNFTDLGTYNAACDEMIDSTNPIFSGLSPNCSSCTWVYQATNLPVIFPIDVSTYPSNSSFVITCIDLINCCETILKIETGCCDDACPTNWLGVDYTDPCCVELDLEVADNCHTFKKIITEIVTPGVNYSSVGIGAPYTSSWTGNSIDPQTLTFTPTTPTTGSFPNLVELCIENIGGIMPQQIDVHYVVCASTGLDSIACTESIYLQCQPITPTPCLDIKSDTVYCNAVGDYSLDFCVTNNGPVACMMTDLNLWVTAPMTISPSAFTGLTIASGECFCGTLAVGSTGIGGAMSGDPLEVFFSSNCCPNDVATLNTVLPDCDDCAVSSVDLGTGTGITSAGTDASWTVISDPIVSTVEPRPADIIAPYPTWSPPFAGTEWMSAIPSTTGGPMGDYVFERCFCMGDVIVDPYLELNVLADDIAQICLNGNPIGIANSSVTPTVISTSNPSFFQTGQNCIQAKLTNFDNNLMGINIAGFVSATEGLQQDNCCEDPAKITGFKWNDINGDGIWQTFEPAIPGWTILLSNGETTETDATGKYEFCVDAGTYQVNEELNPDWAQTFPATAGGYHTVTVDWGDVVTDINFGNHELCPTTVILTDDTYTPGTGIIIQADQSLISGQNNVAGPNNNSGSIIYQAGQDINLGAGFEIEIGVEFEALIQGCSNTTLQQETGDKAINTETNASQKDQ